MFNKKKTPIILEFWQKLIMGAAIKDVDVDTLTGQVSRDRSRH